MDRGGSFIVAIAARTTLDNYLSGFVIHLEGNFKVGDWIYSTDKQIEGIIEYMGMRTTTLRTLDKRLLFVPNSFFSTSSIVNASKMTNRKIDDVIPIERTNQVTVNDIIYDVRAMLRDHPDIDHAQEAMANFINFGSSALHINVRAFTKTKDLKNFRNVRQDVMLKVMEIVEKHGVALAPSCYLEVTQKSKKSTLL